MVNSSAYIDFKKQIKAKGREKLDGYNPDLFKLIRVDERKEIEKDIYDNFVKKNDTDLAIFMPDLKNYDGICALKNKISELRIPSYASADVAVVLFKITGESQYLDIIMKNYRGLSVNTPIVADLSYLTRDPSVYSALVDIYINDEDDTNRTQAVLGILWNDGFIENIKDPIEIFQKIHLLRPFDLNSCNERAEFIRRYQSDHSCLQ